MVRYPKRKKRKKKKRKLREDITERPDREVMEKLFGKRVMKEVEKVTKPAKTKGD